MPSWCHGVFAQDEMCMKERKKGRHFFNAGLQLLKPRSIARYALSPAKLHFNLRKMAILLHIRAFASFLPMPGMFHDLPD